MLVLAPATATAAVSRLQSLGDASRFSFSISRARNLSVGREPAAEAPSVGNARRPNANAEDRARAIGRRARRCARRGRRWKEGRRPRRGQKDGDDDDDDRGHATSLRSWTTHAAPYAARTACCSSGSPSVSVCPSSVKSGLQRWSDAPPEFGHASGCRRAAAAPPAAAAAAASPTLCPARTAYLVVAFRGQGGQEWWFRSVREGGGSGTRR